MRFPCFLLVSLSLIGSTTSLQAQDQDTLLMVRLKEVEIRDAHQWHNDTARYRFNQLRYYVTTVWPYVLAASKTIGEVESLTREATSKKQKRSLVRQKETDLRNRFEQPVKALNETQGVLLIKLIARQTGGNIFDLLREYKNPLTAVKWQTWAGLHGFNLNKRYDPDAEPLLEKVLYSLGYDLPVFYDSNSSVKH